MSEYYTPPEDGSDELDLTIRGEQFKANRHNTTLWTHIGEAALYDHIFIVLSEEEESKEGVYVWAHPDTIDEVHETYDKLVDPMVSLAYPMHLNLVEASEFDRNHYHEQRNTRIERQVQELSGDLGDTIPDEWEEGA